VHKPHHHDKVADLGGGATIPLSSSLGQVVYSHCLRSFSAPRNWGTQESSRRLIGYGDLVR